MVHSFAEGRLYLRRRVSTPLRRLRQIEGQIPAWGGWWRNPAFLDVVEKPARSTGGGGGAEGHGAQDRCWDHRAQPERPVFLSMITGLRP
jgi:hypothetical protein